MVQFIFQTLEKIGFSHPLHPPVVHIPMGLIFGALIFIIGGKILQSDDLEKTALHCITLALLFIPPTLIAGFLDWQYTFQGVWMGLIVTKMILALILTIILFLGVCIGRGDYQNKYMIIIYASSFLLVGIIGFLGGEILYG